jgi:hypothetical protein
MLLPGSVLVLCRWQLGAVQYLMQHFQLSKVPMVGASGGGLAAVLATCDVDPEEVMESAYRLSKQHNIWERPLGLMGTWGYVIEEWLDELLPADAAERCRDQVGGCGAVACVLVIAVDCVWYVAQLAGGRLVTQLAGTLLKLPVYACMHMRCHVIVAVCVHRLCSPVPVLLDMKQQPSALRSLFPSGPPPLLPPSHICCLTAADAISRRLALS